MLLEAIVIGVLSGILIQHGKLNWLSMFKLKGIYWSIGAFFIEALANIALKKSYLSISLTFWIEVLVYVCLFVFCWLNRENKVFYIIFAGIFLNACVILLNGGYMPVDVSAANMQGYTHMIENLSKGYIFGHCVLTDQTHLPWLGDIFNLMPPYPFPKSFSTGDILIDFGVIGLFVQNVRSTR